MLSRVSHTRVGAPYDKVQNKDTGSKKGKWTLGKEKEREKKE